MEESLQSTLLLAQRTADEVKAAAHKEADLIKQQARFEAQREISSLADQIYESQREAQRHQDTAEKAKSELRSLLMSHLAILERTPMPASAASAAAATTSPSATQGASAANGETDALEQLPLSNGSQSHLIVE
jgi:cell division initiation protein